MECERIIQNTSPNRKMICYLVRSPRELDLPCDFVQVTSTMNSFLLKSDSRTFWFNLRFLRYEIFIFDLKLVCCAGNKWFNDHVTQNMIFCTISDEYSNVMKGFNQIQCQILTCTYTLQCIRILPLRWNAIQIRRTASRSEWLNDLGKEKFLVTGWFETKEMIGDIHEGMT